MKKVRIALWCMTGVIVVFLGYSRLSDNASDRAAMQNTNTQVDIGGSFSIASTTGEHLNSDSLIGKPWMLFFGFTYCPDICPTTLYEMSGWFESLGEKADDLRGVFVSVDPQRDSIEILKNYISSFDDRIIAVRPESSELSDLATKFKVYYKKVPTDGDGGYTMDHSAGIRLFDRKGRFFGTIDTHEDRDIVLKKLERLLAKS